MEEIHKNALKKCRLLLAKNLLGDQVFQHLVENGILNDHLVEKINSKLTSFDKNVEFLTVLPKRGPKAFQSFLDSLHSSDQSYLAESLVSSSKVINSQNETSPGKNLNATILSIKRENNNQNQFVNSSRKRPSVENEEELSQEQLFSSLICSKKQCINRCVDKRLNDIVPSPCGPLDDILSTSPLDSLIESSCFKTKVNGVNNSFAKESFSALSFDLADGPCLNDLVLRKRNPTYQRSHFYDCYEMVSTPRGLALIISVDHFEPSACLDDRQAGEVDRARLEFVLRQLGFRCYILVDGTAQEIANVLQKFVALEDHEACNATMLIVMSHGEEGSFFGRDGLKVHIDKVIQLFSNTMCKAMQNKPKILLFQSCRGNLPDQGVDEVDGPGRPTFIAAPEADLSSSRSSLGSEQSCNKLPTQSDYLIGYATVKGYAAMRNTKRGSWYIQALVRVLAYHACDKHLIEMMTIVNEMIKGKEGNSPTTDFHRCKEMSVFHSTLCKNLYLFPP